MRIRILAAMMLATTALAGCGTGDPAPSQSPSPAAVPQPSPKPGDTTFTMDWKGNKRTYLVHAPAGYDGTKPLPVVIVMHFFPGTGSEVAVTSGMSAKADRENFLAVYPDGYAGGMNALVCCGTEDDTGFIKSIVDKMVTDWKADPKRVYATGISNGADMGHSWPGAQAGGLADPAAGISATDLMWEFFKAHSR